jgi:ABC-2 type transport system ATP-binding protein
MVKNTRNIPAISINKLSKCYDDVLAVDNLSFDVKKGSFFGFLGPNGAGKTTTINSIIGLVLFQGGLIKVFGHDVVKNFREARKLIGLAPQEFNFDRYLTVKEILIYQAGYYGIRQKDCESRAEELLHQFDIYNKRNVTPEKLSGGMKRRLTMARALINEPKLLILDEPTAGMDVELRHQMWDFLRKTNKKGLTVFLTTHYIEEAEELCDKIGIINKGKLVTLANTKDITNGKKLEQTYLELTKNDK